MGDPNLVDGLYKLTRIETISDSTINKDRLGFSDKDPGDKYLLNNNDILYSNINSIDHIGKVAIYKGEFPLYHGINLLRISPFKGIDPEFLYQYLSRLQSRRWAKSHANPAVNQVSLNQSTLGTYVLAVCSISEQRKIGRFLSAVDKNITIHQR